MPEEKPYIDTVRELIEDRDGQKVIAGLDRTELLDLLECVIVCVQNSSHVSSFSFFPVLGSFVVFYTLCLYCVNKYNNYYY